MPKTKRRESMKTIFIIGVVATFISIGMFLYSISDKTEYRVKEIMERVQGRVPMQGKGSVWKDSFLLQRKIKPFGRWRTIRTYTQGVEAYRELELLIKKQNENG